MGAVKSAVAEPSLLPRAEVALRKCAEVQEEEALGGAFDSLRALLLQPAFSRFLFVNLFFKRLVRKGTVGLDPAAREGGVLYFLVFLTAQRCGRAAKSWRRSSCRFDAPSLPPWQRGGGWKYCLQTRK
jgi:hypothetical protein